MERFLRINEVAEKFKISKRTLRYYEEMGLITSVRHGTSSCRFYDNPTISRIEHILILRSLNFSINQIKEILFSENNQIPITLLMDRYRTVQSEIGNLISIRQIIEAIICQYRKGNHGKLDMYKLLKDQIYTNEKIEGVLNIGAYNGYIFDVQFGIDIVPYAESIIDNVKSLRKSLEAKYKKDLPLIRIRDVEDLEKLEYTLSVKGITVAHRSFKDSAGDLIVTMITTDLKTIIENNVDKF